MLKLEKFKHTFAACFIGVFIQAIVCGFVPLLFLIFNREYNITLVKLTLLSTVNYVAQFTTDSVSIFFLDKLGYRRAALLSHGLAAFGFVFMGLVAPQMPNPYFWIMVSVICFSIGGGLLEVILSPVIEACPAKNKSATLSLLHSMFGIGSVTVILTTTVTIAVFGWQIWRSLSVLWGILTFANGIYFSVVPINDMTKSEQKMSISQLFSEKTFWVFMLVMACGGAAEIGMSQWASAFAESSLGISKTAGDILGPCAFALMMAFSRFLYYKTADKVELSRCIVLCGVLGTVCYLGAALIPISIVALLFCGLCGFAVGILWPGTLSLASKAFPTAGAALFALMALAGDLGCTLGPTVVGFVSSFFGGDLKSGLLAGAAFPLILIIGLVTLREKKPKPAKEYIKQEL